MREALFTFRDEQGHEAEIHRAAVVGRVARRAPIALDEFSYLRSIAAATAKITLPAPSTMHFWRGRHFADPGVYDDVRAFSATWHRLPPEIADLAEPAAATSSSTK